MRTQKRYTEEEKLEIVLMALRNEGHHRRSRGELRNLLRHRPDRLLFQIQSGHTLV